VYTRSAGSRKGGDAQAWHGDDPGVFPDTAACVDSSCHLFAGQQGMYVVDRQNIYILTIA
jgi:hypothetical protein